MLDKLSSQILGLAFNWADGVLEAPDHARAKIATRRFRKAMEYILQKGEVPPEDWKPNDPQYPPLDVSFESHTYGISGPVVETETWKGLTPP